MKQTAVEWLLENLNSEPYSEEEFNYNRDCWDKAKAMEKEQIIDAYRFGIQDEYVIGSRNYYNETFKQQSVTDDTL
jgi:hypothetical protein